MLSERSNHLFSTELNVIITLVRLFLVLYTSLKRYYFTGSNTPHNVLARSRGTSLRGRLGTRLSRSPPARATLGLAARGAALASRYGYGYTVKSNI